MKPPVLQLRDWSVFRNGRRLAGPLSVNCASTEITVLMGVSGVGKTSLLLSALGYSEDGLSADGIRHENGRPLRPGELLRSLSVYIPQNVPFNPNWEVTSFLCRLPWGERKWWHSLWPETRSRRLAVLSILKQLGLAHRAHATVSELSGGECMRAALAQLFLVKPHFYAADELANGLDPGIAQWVLQQCRRIVEETGGAALMAMHDVFAALQVADQIVVMWPAKAKCPPLAIREGDACWDPEILRGLLCLARWADELPTSAGLQQLITQLGTVVTAQPQSEGVALWFGANGAPEEKPIAALAPLLQAALGAGPGGPIRHEETGRTVIGLTWHARDGKKRAALAEAIVTA